MLRRFSELLEYFVIKNLVISCELVAVGIVIKYLISLITSAPKLNGCVFTNKLALLS